MTAATVTRVIDNPADDVVGIVAGPFIYMTPRSVYALMLDREGFVVGREIVVTNGRLRFA